MSAFRLLLLVTLMTAMLFIPLISSESSDSSRINYGIWGGVHLNIHSADFKKIPDCESCSPGYKSGDGIGFGIGAVIDVPIWDKWFISGKLFYKTLDAELISMEPTTVIQEELQPDGTTKFVYSTGEFEHSLDSKFSIIGIEPSMKYNVIDNLFLNGGFQGALILGKKYSQVERIIIPNGATFIGTDKSERNKYDSRTLESANSLYFGVNVSLSYQLPINATKEWFLEPELFYTLGLTNLVNDELVNKWKPSSIGGVMALKYSPKPKEPLKEEFKRIEIIDTIRMIVDNIDKDKFLFGLTQKDTNVIEDDRIRLTQETISRTDTIKIARIYALKGDVDVVGVDSLNNEIINPKFRIEEFILNRLEPLLNYIFFDKNSSVLPDRYKRMSIAETQKFRTDSLLHEETLDVYYQILNIVGRRLTDYPKANLSIVGCNSGIGEEKGNLKLSEERANNVRDYLINTWQIDPKRLKMEYRNLSQKPSTKITEPDKIQENQRVELHSDEYEILKPVFINDTNRVATPAILRLKPTATADAGLAKWSTSAFQALDSNNIRFDAAGTDVLTKNNDWYLETSQKNIPIYPEPIIYTLSLKDKKNKEVHVRKQTVPVDIVTISRKRVERQGDYEIERFSLILFDFAKATITANNQKIIDFIKSRVQDSSEVEIIGYTDRTGNPEINRTLAKKRADAAKKELNAKISEAKNGDVYLFDNDLPEGRFYCRTVRIIVKTKIK